tara:strand:+ start:467 stop:649 length:183 start_codon:yes stop_codon:yes gene_type:complete
MVKMNNILEDVNNINEDLNFQLIEQGKDIDEINIIMDDNYRNMQAANTHLRETHRKRKES